MVRTIDKTPSIKIKDRNLYKEHFILIYRRFILCKSYNRVINFILNLVLKSFLMH